MVRAFQPPGVWDNKTKLGKVLLSFSFPGKALHETWEYFISLKKYWVSVPIMCFKVVLLPAQVSYGAVSAPLLFPALQRKKSAQSNPSFIDFMNLSQELPIMKSKNNIWGEWKPHWKKKKEKISTKNPFPFNFHGKPYFSSTSQAAKNGCSNLGVKSGCWGPKLSRRFPFPGQQTLGKALNDCQSLRILFGQGCSLKFCSSKPQKLQRFTITWTAKILLCHSRA